jgi:hypothetical protein
VNTLRVTAGSDLLTQWITLFRKQELSELTRDV